MDYAAGVYSFPALPLLVILSRTYLLYIINCQCTVAIHFKVNSSRKNSRQTRASRKAHECLRIHQNEWFKETITNALVSAERLSSRCFCVERREAFRWRRENSGIETWWTRRAALPSPGTTQRLKVPTVRTDWMYMIVVPLDCPWKEHQPLKVFGFFNLTLEYLKRPKSSKPLHAKMNPTSCLFGSRFA